MRRMVDSSHGGGDGIGVGCPGKSSFKETEQLFPPRTPRFGDEALRAAKRSEDVGADHIVGPSEAPPVGGGSQGDEGSGSGGGELVALALRAMERLKDHGAWIVVGLLAGVVLGRYISRGPASGALGFPSKAAAGAGADNDEAEQDSEGSAWESDSEVEEDEGTFEGVPPGELKMVLVVRTDIKMGKGKIAAQCGHATLGAYRRALRKPLWKNYVAAWLHRGQAKITLRVESEEQLEEVGRACAEADLPTYIVVRESRCDGMVHCATCAHLFPFP